MFRHSLINAYWWHYGKKFKYLSNNVLITILKIRFRRNIFFNSWQFSWVLFSLKYIAMNMIYRTQHILRRCKWLFQRIVPITAISDFPKNLRHSYDHILPIQLLETHWCCWYSLLFYMTISFLSILISSQFRFYLS